MEVPRPSRRSLALLLAAGMLALATPAKAALPSSSPTDTHRCANGKTAKAWAKFGSSGLARLAADNPCKGQWVAFSFTGQSASDPYGTRVFIAPGQRVNLEGADLEWGLSQWGDENGGGSRLVDATNACVTNRYYPDSGWTGFNGLLFLSEKDVRDAPECGDPIPKYSANHRVALPCPSPDEHEISLTYKTEGKKIVKLAVSDRFCKESERWAIAWWKLDNGRTVGVWVAPGEEIDLWKSDFGQLPVKSKDGRVRLTTAPAGDEDDAFRSDPKKRPFYYNGFIEGDDTVSCTAGRKSC